MKIRIITCTALLFTACTSTEYKEDLAKCERLTFVAKDSCLLDLAIKHKSTEPCTQIRQSGVRIPCMIQGAVAACDISLCENIGEQWQRPNCIDRVQSAPQCQES